jgi:excisionase family DNA binding protein
MGVPDSTVFQWVERDGLPATQVDGQFRFHPAAVYEWAAERALPLVGNLFGDGLASIPVGRALRTGGVVSRARGADHGALASLLAERLPLPAHVDRSAIKAILLALASLGSVVIG